MQSPSFRKVWTSLGPQRLLETAIEAARRAGQDIPAGVGTTGAGAEPASYYTRNPDTEETLGDIAEPTFKRGMTF